MLEEQSPQFERCLLLSTINYQDDYEFLKILFLNFLKLSLIFIGTSFKNICMGLAEFVKHVQSFWMPTAEISPQETDSFF